jgi:hypothetical protein
LHYQCQPNTHKHNIKTKPILKPKGMNPNSHLMKVGSPWFNPPTYMSLLTQLHASLQPRTYLLPIFPPPLFLLPCSPRIIYYVIQFEIVYYYVYYIGNNEGSSSLN